MKIISYYSAGGKDLILKYIDSLETDERIDGYNVLKEALIKSRLTTWHTSCLQIFRHLARKLLEIRKYSRTS